MTPRKPKYGNKVLSDDDIGMLCFHLPRPPSVNQCYGTNFKTRRRFKTKKYLAWIKEAGWACIKMGRAIKVPGKINIKYSVATVNDRRVRDVANYEKPLSDFLVSRQLIDDDSMIEKVQIEWAKHVKEGSVYVQIEAVI